MRLSLVFQIIRFCTFLVALITFALCSLLGILLFPQNVIKRNRYLGYVMKLHSRFLLWVFNHHVFIKQTDPKISIDGNQNYLIVSNHLSYLDMLLISSFVPTSFVTSVEIKETPGLGQISKMAGCFYVERRNRSQLGFEIMELTEALNQNCNITIFPEATSTNGESVLRFKRPLFKAAILAKRSILPITINYLSINNNPITPLNRDQVCWYGEMTFFSHFWSLLKIRKLEIELVIQTPMSIEDYNEENFDQCSTDSHQKVSSFFRPIAISSINYNGEVLP